VKDHLVPLWDRFQRYLWVSQQTALSIDVSRVHFPEEYIENMAPAFSAAMEATAAMEAGCIANPGENRMVGHFWLRAPVLAPSPEIAAEIEHAVTDVMEFARKVHSGVIRAETGSFRETIHIGIGGSALGPQLLCDALHTNRDPVRINFLDNADPESIDRLVERLKNGLDQTIVSIVSKCGFTPTPRYVEQQIEKAYERLGLNYVDHAVATTTPGSELEQLAERNGWLARFPVWDWVGGRFSVSSAVGLLPAALQGVDIPAFLQGAAAMDQETRASVASRNPAGLLALMWFWLGRGRGDKNMIVLPYKDRLSLLPRYVQQLVMESIGKKLNRAGVEVEQGLTVYGNKGSTDQHAYLQQLRAGKNDFFVLFVRVKDDGLDEPYEIKPDVTLGDYLFCSAEGTRDALETRGRNSITITLPDLTARSMGSLIALLERAVGIYAELIDVNAYDQPGVDKFVAEGLADLQQQVQAYMRASVRPQGVQEIANGIGRPLEVESVFKLLDRLAGIPRRGVDCQAGNSLLDAQYILVEARNE
jgi:glucose-6-phosphate isomerase